MSASRNANDGSRGAVWWSTSGLIGYLGLNGRDGLEWRRHAFMCRPGMWAIGITGWSMEPLQAVVDDFGNLVQVAT